MIEVVCTPYPEATAQARRDFAIVTGVKQFDPPYWFKDTVTGKEYKGIYGCIGWPGTVTDINDQSDGYACIVGVDNNTKEQFRILDECSSLSPEVLVDKAIKMRNRWGFRVHPDLIPIFLGDHLRFELVVAQRNSRILSTGGKNADVFIVSPPDDFEIKDNFDLYFRRLQYSLSPESKRLYIGKAEIVRRQLISFKRGDPAVMALGGLVHTLLGRRPWQARSEPSVFEMEGF